MSQTPPVVLTIAGFDPSSGAGVSADIKTIAAHGCYGIAAITAITVQSTAGIRRVSPVDPRLLTDTLDELTSDMKVSAAHIGMLGSGEIASLVAQFLEKAQLPNVVLDPILKSSTGASLLDQAGVSVLKERLLPLATVITPNVHEATTLTGVPIENVEDMKLAAQRLQEMGAQGVVVTGGHLERAIDLLSLKDQYVLYNRGHRQRISDRQRLRPGQSHVSNEKPSADNGNGKEIGFGEGLVLRLPTLQEDSRQKSRAGGH